MPLSSAFLLILLIPCLKIVLVGLTAFTITGLLWFSMRFNVASVLAWIVVSSGSIFASFRSWAFETYHGALIANLRALLILDCILFWFLTEVCAQISPAYLATGITIVFISLTLLSRLNLLHLFNSGYRWWRHCPIFLQSSVVCSWKSSCASRMTPRYLALLSYLIFASFIVISSGLSDLFLFWK